MSDVRVAVPRKGRPLEAVLRRVAERTGRTDLVDGVVSTLRYEKALAKGSRTDDRSVYERLDAYSDPTTPNRPEFTLLRDARPGMPRRIVFDSITVELAGRSVQFVGREEPFRALRKHEFALGFDSADLVLEEVVTLEPGPLESIDELNARIDPRDTDVRVVSGLGDTVYHTLLATPDVADAFPEPLSPSFVERYRGPLCISPRYERLVEAVLGTDATAGVEFTYPDDESEESAIADVGLGVYLTVTGSTARDCGLVIGDRLFPSETVLLENVTEGTRAADDVAAAIVEAVGRETALV